MTATSPSPSRRALLTTAAGAAGVLALSACGSDDDASTSGGSTPPDDATGSPGGSDAATSPGPAPGAPGGGEPLAALGDVPVGQAASATTPEGDQVMLFRPDESTVACFSAICTHQGCPVEPDGAELRCPCHQSVFDAATGEVLGGPAPEPLPPVTVRIEDGQIVTG